MRWRINVFREAYAENHLRNRVDVGEMVEEMEQKSFIKTYTPSTLC